MRIHRLLATAVTTLAFAAGCGEKPPVDDSFDALAGVDEKADTFLSQLRLLGSLDYGQTSATVRHTGTPRYAGYKFGGHKGDMVDIWVRSKDGDAVAWLLDNNFRTIAVNDDASARTTDAHLIAKLPGNTNPDIITYYVVYREYLAQPAKFTVALAGKPAAVDLTSCKLDADCALIERGCCAIGDYTAVRADQVTAYHDTLGCADHMICPAIRIQDQGAVAVCNASKKCEAQKGNDVVCGARSTNPHHCAAGWTCYGPGAAYDGVQHCYKNCGGIAGIGCNAGTSCADNPTDSCDPAHGGADCGGLCLTN